jgi:hypothetical protein
VNENLTKLMEGRSHEVKDLSDLLRKGAINVDSLEQERDSIKAKLA